MSNIFFTEKNGKYTIPIIRDGFTVNDENPEFSDDFLVNWSYPYNIYQTDLIKRIFPDFSNPNVIKRKKDRGYLTIEGDVYPADIKFLGAQLSQLKIQFEFGVGMLPVMDKQLSEIDFGEFNTPNMYDYVDSVIKKTYPEVNFCFPQIYNAKYFPDKYGKNYIDLWPVFNLTHIDGSGILKVTRNEIGFDRQLIVSAMKPCPYLLFIIKKGFENEGFELKGDILTDEFLKNICLDHNNTTDLEFSYDIKTLELLNNISGLGNYKKTEVFEIVGDYTVSFFCPKPNIEGGSVSISLKNVKTGALMYNDGYTWSHIDDPEGQGDRHFLFDLETNLNPLEVEFSVGFNDINAFIPFGSRLKAYLNPRLNKENTNKFILQKKKFIGSEYMPEGSFKDLVLMVKKLRNFHVYTTQKQEIYFDYVDNNMPKNYINLEFSEQFDVEINSNEKENYIISYNAPEEMKFPDYLVNKSNLVEVKKSDFKDAVVLDFNAYPLLKTVHEIFNIMSVEEKETTVQGFALFNYVGISDSGYNYSSEIRDFVPRIYKERYKNYINNRLFSDLMKWSFSTKRNMKNLKSKSVIYAYGCFHKIKTLTKTFFEDNVTKIDIETENRY